MPHFQWRDRLRALRLKYAPLNSTTASVNEASAESKDKLNPKVGRLLLKNTNQEINEMRHALRHEKLYILSSQLGSVLGNGRQLVLEKVASCLGSKFGNEVTTTVEKNFIGVESLLG